MPATEVGAQSVNWVKTIFSFRMMLASGLVVVYVLTIANRFNDPDLWFHLKLGEVMWNTHRIPSTELFSHTAFGHSWTAHEWLAQTTIYEAYRLAGYSGLMGWFTGFGALLFLVVYTTGYRHAENELVAFLAALLAFFFGTVGFAIRPQLLGYTFLAAELLLLEAAARNRRLLWVFPPLFAIWVNCHGSYAFGIGVLAIHWICSFVKGKWSFVVSEGADPQERNRFGLVVLLSALGLFASPVGWRLLLYPVDVLFHQSTGLGAVDEWLPPDLGSGRTLAMVAAAMSIPVLCVFRRTQLQLRDLLVASAAFWLASQHVRMMFVFGIVVGPLLCRLLGNELKRDAQREHPIANAFLILMGVATIVGALPTAQNLQEQIAKTSPVGAVQYIRRNGIRGPMLNDYVFGGYLIWALPEERVFVDGRSDVYDWTGVLAEYGRWATLADDPQTLLDKHRIRLCILSRNSPMTRVMTYLPNWRKAYLDEVAVVFTR